MGLPQGYAMENEYEVTVPYPAKTSQASGEINQIPTQVTSMSFSDKIMITITQNGRLAQWVTVPLLSDNPTEADPHFNVARSEDDSLLPTVRFQARTLLGAGTNDREMMGQLYASQIASMITTKNPEESRTLLLGLGLPKLDSDRDIFLDTMNLVMQVL